MAQFFEYVCKPQLGQEVHVAVGSSTESEESDIYDELQHLSEIFRHWEEFGPKI